MKKCQEGHHLASSPDIVHKTAMVLVYNLLLGAHYFSEVTEKVQVEGAESVESRGRAR